MVRHKAADIQQSVVAEDQELWFFHPAAACRKDGFDKRSSGTISLHLIVGGIGHVQVAVVVKYESVRFAKVSVLSEHVDELSVRTIEAVDLIAGGDVQVTSRIECQTPRGSDARDKTRP